MITNKHLGSIFIILGIILVILTFGAKIKEDYYMNALIAQNDGQCILDDGYCLHQDRNWTGYIISWVLGASSIILGGYLVFFDKSYEAFRKEQASFAKELRHVKAKESFQAYLAGFSEDEQTILKAVQEQDGITQSTLRYRTGMSKATLSLTLNSLEERDVISRKPSGKTKAVYLRKKF